MIRFRTDTNNWALDKVQQQLDKLFGRPVVVLKKLHKAITQQAMESGMLHRVVVRVKKQGDAKRSPYQKLLDAHYKSERGTPTQSIKRQVAAAASGK